VNLLEVIKSSPSCVKAHKKREVARVHAKNAVKIQAAKEKAIEAKLLAADSTKTADLNKEPADYSQFDTETAFVLAKMDGEIDYNVGKRNDYTTLLTHLNHKKYASCVPIVKVRIKHYSAHVEALKMAKKSLLKSVKLSTKGKKKSNDNFDQNPLISSGEFCLPPITQPSLQPPHHANPLTLLDGA
jgi:hypothetical protein